MISLDIPGCSRLIEFNPRFIKQIEIGKKFGA
jgi:hypothetical protein